MSYGRTRTKSHSLLAKLMIDLDAPIVPGQSVAGVLIGSNSRLFVTHLRSFVQVIVHLNVDSHRDVLPIAGAGNEAPFAHGRYGSIVQTEA